MYWSLVALFAVFSSGEIFRYRTFEHFCQSDHFFMGPSHIDKSRFLAFLNRFNVFFRSLLNLKFKHLSQNVFNYILTLSSNQIIRNALLLRIVNHVLSGGVCV